jgi:hypothetical protein
MGWLGSTGATWLFNNPINSRYKKTIAGAVCNHTSVTFLLARPVQNKQLYSAVAASTSLVHKASLCFELITTYGT